MAQVSIFSPWKDASQRRGGQDFTRILYVKEVGDTDIAGAQVTASVIQVATAVDTLTFTTNAAADTDINSYTGATALAGAITTTDGNANTVGKIVDIINGVGVGQNANARYRAALADVPPLEAVVASDFTAVGPVNIMLGRTHVGLPLLSTSATAGLRAAYDLWVGIGTAGGCIEGAGWQYPDYFADIPGSSTTASVNTAIRRGAVGRKDHDAVTRKMQYRVTGFASTMSMDATYNICVHDIWGNVVFETPLTLGVPTLFQDYSATPIVGPVGSPLFVRFWGTTGITVDGAVMVMAEGRVC
jgi:hypothetical protein